MSSLPTGTPTSRSLGDRLLGGVEKWGNRLPDPLILFTGLFLTVAVLSTVFGALGTTVTVPGSEEGPVTVKPFFSGEGLSWFTTTLGENYIGFPPLVNVLPIILAVGVAEGSGLLGTSIRMMFGSAPRWLLPYAVAFVGVMGNLMSDTAFVVIPPLAALVFTAAGRHPMAGLLGGFAAAGAAFSTNLLPSPIDGNFAGITTSVIGALPSDLAIDPVTIVSNYWVNIASSLVIILATGLLIDRVLEPRLERMGVSRTRVDTTDLPDDGSVTSGDQPAPSGTSPGGKSTDEQQDVDVEVTPQQRRAVRWAMIAGAVFLALVLVAVLPAGSAWRNEEGAFLPRSPFMSSIVFLIVAFFLLTGIVYGKVAGTIQSGGDVGRLMGEGLKTMLTFLVLAFVLAQFLALFTWSNLGTVAAVKGAEGLESIGLTGPVVILLFILLCAGVNLIITSGTSMWGLMAAVFVPMFALIGFEPAFVQAAFRIGDSSTQIITPLNPYLIVLLGMVRRYEPAAGLGTLISRLLPFTIVFFIVWTVTLGVFYAFDLPIGPGNGIHLD
ncbi:AbgT family transporter [Micrococcus terreus]|uniref:AbgT family transporter n=1 Tax=Micrococcus terreus TaxID=574650 RepID=UPI0021A62686|nr:AbgT family transporter [Micrococcus terreus]MCT2089020.1 AbgT family transporter [Micrococcus terreus]